MSLMKTPWAALMDMQLQRSHQIAWFVYGWIEREHLLNMTACADWWIRAARLPTAQLKAPKKDVGNSVPQVETQVLAHNGDRAEANRHRSPRQGESLS
jgi:hypothetical protein